MDNEYNTHKDRGYVLNWRDIDDAPWYKDADVSHLAQHLIRMVNYKDNKILINGKLRTIKRGQRVIGHKVIESQTGLTRAKYRRCLGILEGSDFLTLEVHKGGDSNHSNTIVTICNYDTYQCDDKKLDRRTTEEQPKNNRRTTEEQPQTIKISKEKKEKKEKNNSTVAISKNSKSKNSVKEEDPWDIDDCLTEEELGKPETNVDCLRGIQSLNDLELLLTDLPFSFNADVTNKCNSIEMVQFWSALMEQLGFNAGEFSKSKSSMFHLLNASKWVLPDDSKKIGVAMYEYISKNLFNSSCKKSLTKKIKSKRKDAGWVKYFTMYLYPDYEYSPKNKKEENNNNEVRDIMFEQYGNYVPLEEDGL